MQRAIDQMIIDNAITNDNVVFCLDRAGLVGDDGPTHHGVFDLVYARMVPGMRVLAPSDEAELVNGLHTALALGGPFAIRYPRGAAEGVPLPDEPEVMEPGVARRVREGSDVAILAFGRMVGQAARAAELLAEDGIEARVVDMRWAKPLDHTAIKNAAQTKLVVTIEEGVVCGGRGRRRARGALRAGACRADARAGHPRPVRGAGQGGPAVQRDRPRSGGHCLPYPRGAGGSGCFRSRSFIGALLLDGKRQGASLRAAENKNMLQIK